MEGDLNRSKFWFLCTPPLCSLSLCALSKLHPLNTSSFSYRCSPPPSTPIFILIFPQAFSIFFASHVIFKGARGSMNKDWLESTCFWLPARRPDAEDKYWVQSAAFTLNGTAMRIILHQPVAIKSGGIYTSSRHLVFCGRQWIKKVICNPELIWHQCLLTEGCSPLYRGDKTPFWPSWGLLFYSTLCFTALLSHLVLSSALSTLVQGWDSFSRSPCGIINKYYNSLSFSFYTRGESGMWFKTKRIWNTGN